MTSEDLGDFPPYVAKKLRLQQEIRDIVASVTSQPPDAEYLPDGYFARETTPEWEIAEHLAAYGRHTSSYRPEH